MKVPLQPLLRLVPLPQVDGVSHVQPRQVEWEGLEGSALIG